MKLYYAPGACSLATHIALEEGGGTYQTEQVDLSTHRTASGEDFYSISPRGYVPALETEGMGLLTENPAVLTYVAEKTGAAPKGDAYYHMLEWIGFIGTEIHGGFGPLFGGDSEERQATAKKNLAQKYHLAVQLMDDREWLVGDTPTVADNYLLVTLLWSDKFGIELPGELRNYRDRNMKRDAVRKAMADEGLT